MGLFYKPSRKKLLEIRSDIFLNYGLSALYKNGFSKSPFSTSLFGRNNLNDFSYELCRLSSASILEHIIVHITRGDKWIKIYLNVFQLSPDVGSLELLKGLEGTRYYLPPNSVSEMRLRSDDYRGVPLFYMLFKQRHKLGRFYTKNGLKKRTCQLANLIAEDMTNIEKFIVRWHQIHKIAKVNWDGSPLQSTH